jgi:hypothetical protein
VPDYLPLCALRQGLLPDDCRSCAWWQTTGSGPKNADDADRKRRQWTVALEPTWGSTGLLIVGDGTQGGRRPAGSAAASVGRSAATVAVSSICYAPATAVPRLRELSFFPLPAGAALLFCLKSQGDHGRGQARRLLHKGLAQLKERGVQEAFAVATLATDAQRGDGCRFFSLEFLEANGFQRVRNDGQLLLMRIDLRGLLSLVTQVEAIVRRVFHHEPTPSPAAWTHRGES